jgi:hypothetical protein
MLCFYLYVDAAEKHKSDEQAKVKGLVKQVKAKVKGSSDVDKDTGLVENVMPKKVKKARLVDTDVAVKNLTLNVKGPSKEKQAAPKAKGIGLFIFYLYFYLFIYFVMNT